MRKIQQRVSGRTRAALMALAAVLLVLVPAASVATGDARSRSSEFEIDESAYRNAATATSPTPFAWRNVADIPDLVDLIGTPTPAPQGPDGEGAVKPVRHLVVPPAEYEAALGQFRMPLVNWDAVTDRFGVERGNGLVHGGIDIGLGSMPASPVIAACEGAVAEADESPSYGNYVLVDCGDGWSTLYGHLSRIDVSPGTAVTWGDILGLSGSTGISTGEHLHFEIRYLGFTVDPEDYLDFKLPPRDPPTIQPAQVASPEDAADAAATATEEVTPTPEPTGTEAPAPSPTGEPTQTPTESPSEPIIPNVEFVEGGLDGEVPADFVEIAATEDGEIATHLVLALNQLIDGSDPVQATVAATANCEGCAALGVLVQVNLHEGGGSFDPLANRAEASTALECGESCRAYALSLQINIPVGDAATEASAPRLRELLDALGRQLIAFDLEIRALEASSPEVNGSLLEERIATVLEEFPEYIEYVYVVSHSFPAAAQGETDAP